MFTWMSSLLSLLVGLHREMGRESQTLRLRRISQNLWNCKTRGSEKCLDVGRMSLDNCSRPPHWKRWCPWSWSFSMTTRTPQ